MEKSFAQKADTATAPIRPSPKLFHKIQSYANLMFNFSTFSPLFSSVRAPNRKKTEGIFIIKK
jgi:hypothetical protein